MGIFGFDGINMIQSVSHRDQKSVRWIDRAVSNLGIDVDRDATQITTHSITYRDKHVFDIHF